MLIMAQTNTSLHLHLQDLADAFIQNELQYNYSRHSEHLKVKGLTWGPKCDNLAAVGLEPVSLNYESSILTPRI